MIGRKLVASVLAMGFGLALSSALADDVTIIIRGDGVNAQYKRKGLEQQNNVVVFENDMVQWVNEGDRTHTATSDVIVGGVRLFDTGPIAKGKSSVPKKFDFYAKAATAVGKSAGGRVHLGYFCDEHPDTMGGKIVFLPESLRRAKKTGDH